MSKVLSRGCLRFSHDFLCLISCLEVFMRFIALSRPCKSLSSQQRQRRFRHSTSGPYSDRWVVRCASPHTFLQRLQVSMYAAATTQFQRRLPLVISERIFGRRFLQNCAELPREPMLPIVFCSVSFDQSFVFGSTRPVAICTGPGGNRSTTLLLFSRTHPLHFSLNRLIQQTSRSATLGSPNLPTCTKCICGCLCDGKMYSLWTSLLWRRSPVVVYPVG